MTKAVVFDVDGTIVDSVDLHAEAWQEAFKKFGKEVDLEAVRRQIGKGADQLLPVFFSPVELAQFGKELEEYRSNLYKKEYLPHVKAFPKVRELFERIRQDANGSRSHHRPKATNSTRTRSSRGSRILPKRRHHRRMRKSPSRIRIFLKPRWVSSEMSPAIGSSSWEIRLMMPRRPLKRTCTLLDCCAGVGMKTTYAAQVASRFIAIRPSCSHDTESRRSNAVASPKKFRSRT